MFVCTLSYKLQSQEALGRPRTSALLLHRKSWAGQGHQHCYYTENLGQARDNNSVFTQKALGRPDTSALLLHRKLWARQRRQHCCYSGNLGRARDISTVPTLEESLDRPDTSALLLHRKSWLGTSALLLCG